MIEHYSFGKILIQGKQYTSDVIIYPDRVDASWWREKGHELSIDDLKDVFNVKPEIIVIGTGYLGLMKVPQKTIGYIETKGIKVYIERTSRAVDIFNRLQKNLKVVATLHLTC
ncbi:MAG: hypothetical protein HXY52_01050 [Nitrospirae bacterium]|nr:hypothetical protein [Nitrospirota bacterium]